VGYCLFPNSFYFTRYISPFAQRLSELLAAFGCSSLRKRRLLACTMTGRVVQVTAEQALMEYLVNCIEEGERLADGKPFDGRDHLLWSYDRRLRSESIFTAGPQSSEYWALASVNLPLGDHRLLASNLYFGGAAHRAIVGYGQQRFDPDWRDEESYRYLSDQEAEEQLKLARDIFGNPFRPLAFNPAWQTLSAINLAQTMYDARDFAAMPVLADALEDAGCAVPNVLAHCRDPKGGHVRGCWVVDLVLGKT
jgi:hypothetical protein